MDILLTSLIIFGFLLVTVVMVNVMWINLISDADFNLHMACYEGEYWPYQRKYLWDAGYHL